MKNTIFTLLFFSFFAFAASAQVPQAFKYQTVVRDAAGNVQVNDTVDIWFDLIQNGNAVYRENHDGLTTNAFGLVNLEVGHGTVVFGQFDALDWSVPTSIKVYLNGQVMGSSELLSVPYALYAANVAGGSGLPANPQKGDIVYYDGAKWQRLPKGKGGQVLTLHNDGTPAWNGPSTNDLLEVTLPNGEILYVSPVDNNATGGVRWGPFTDITALPNITTLAAANMDFNGETNTTTIVTQLGTNNGTPYAAKLCADLVAYGFDDWYLPAAGELNEMYLKLGPNGSGEITSGIYWSSSEYNGNGAWSQGFAFGDRDDDGKDVSFRCRCVRR